MATPSDDCCAVGADGRLLDASEISWSFDSDPAVIPPASWKPLGSSSPPVPTKNAFDILLSSKGHTSASGTASQRRSTRERRPTEKALENFKSGSRGKRKASPEPCHRVVVRKISHTLDNTDIDTGKTDPGCETEVAEAASDEESSDDTLQVMDYDELKGLEANVAAPIIPKNTRTRDVYIIFEKITNYVNPDTNAIQSGHFCGICQKKKIPMRSCFLSGSVTTLRKHIARNKDHFAVYKEQCEKHNIPLNAAAVPKDSDELSRQSTLDNVIVRRPNVEFSVAGLIDYMIQMIVLEDKYGIDHSKLGWLTADNASNNDTTICNVGLQINVDPDGIAIDQDSPDFWDASSHHSRCMEHIVHLGSGVFIQGIAPASRKNVLSRIRDLVAEEGLGSDMFQTSNPGLAEMLSKNDNPDEDADSNLEDDELTPGDVVGRILALVNQTGCPPQELKLWVRICWASLHAALDRALSLEKAINCFVQTADDDEHWERLRMVHEVLSLPAKATQSFSSVRHPTLSKTIPTLEYIRTVWQAMSGKSQFAYLRPALSKGIANIDKWYNKVNDSPACFITLVLDPTIKLAYVSLQWHSSWVAIGREALEKEFDKYYIPPQQTEVNSTNQNIIYAGSNNGGFGRGWMMASIQDRIRADASVQSDLRAELQRYFDSLLEPMPENGSEFNVIRWWGKRRNRLKPKIFSALQMLKAAYRNGHISADQQAAEHVMDLMKALDEYHFGESATEDESDDSGDTE
ncbi:hypothetical protein K435DRAFT_851686 [Dendrothele bispora CBS 962.96]|uniref:BED-type domain-containing protein n=1 Tax=Dendrothele bispora (strain CBS 962.96) TaxID=1314807 RepID=A0A4S8MMR8_DENBC|nr:hypothetical protein K435DRAFT_851686 [Dendrothele bispora CBS 962.96]